MRLNSPNDFEFKILCKLSKGYIYTRKLICCLLSYEAWYFIAEMITEVL